MRIRPAGEHALLLDCAGPDQVEAWRAELWRRRERGELTAVEIVPGAETVLLDGVPDPARTATLVARWTPHPASPAEPTAGAGGAGAGGVGEVRVPTEFDGPDLAAVAEHWGTDVPEVVRRLTDLRFRVAFCGFAPGFAYLTGLPEGWAVPRLSSPRTRVPAGSVALAGRYAGIYPTESPGGWRLVGRTSLPLFDVHADPPARLTPGTRVRLVPA
ncbi:allophanate hydrolase [Micromonospora rosaria]|uniref:Allophanate hydrolase n=1 Tax=Micromonospora rosaria TaxID=47874 RepID=A0A136PM02_9ACTN|nr:allophanate hydrolase subunit 1 [Micromonospora rosaria]KXK59434.1 allophanate hydrolase [Micromonospora rosaria]